MVQSRDSRPGRLSRRVKKGWEGSKRKQRFRDKTTGGLTLAKRLSDRSDNIVCLSTGTFLAFASRLIEIPV